MYMYVQINDQYSNILILCIVSCKNEDFSTNPDVVRGIRSQISIISCQSSVVLSSLVAFSVIEMGKLLDILLSTTGTVRKR